MKGLTIILSLLFITYGYSQKIENEDFDYSLHEPWVEFTYKSSHKSFSRNDIYMEDKELLSAIYRANNNPQKFRVARLSSSYDSQSLKKIEKTYWKRAKKKFSHQDPKLLSATEEVINGCITYVLNYKTLEDLGINWHTNTVYFFKINGHAYVTYFSGKTEGMTESESIWRTSIENLINSSKK